MNIHQEGRWSKERMGFQDGVISKTKLVTFLLGLRGSFCQVTSATKNPDSNNKSIII